jgi:hypothetical protein
VALAKEIDGVLQELKWRLDGRIEMNATPFRERLDPLSCLRLLTLGFFGIFVVTKRYPSVIGMLHDRAVIVTFDRKGHLPVDLVYAGTARLKVRPDLTTSGDAPTELLAREDVAGLLARLMPIRRLVFGERLIEYDTSYDPKIVTADEVFDRLDALGRLATLLEPPKE